MKTRKYSRKPLIIFILLFLFLILAPVADVSAAIQLEETKKEASPTDPVESLTLDSWTPQANELVLVAVAVRRPNRTVTVSGNGLTFVEIADVDNIQNNSGIHLFRAMGGAPTSGSITISFFDLQGDPIETNCAAAASRFSGVDTGGTNGSGAIEASASDPGPVSDNDDMKVAITTITDDAWTFAAGTYRTKKFEEGELPGSQHVIEKDVIGGDGGDKASLTTWYQAVASGGTTVTMGADNDLSGATDWAIAAVSIKPDLGGATPPPPPPPGSLSVSPATLNLFVGSNGGTTISGGTPVYSAVSADETIATVVVDGTGATIYGQGTGTTTITVSDSDGHSIDVSVSVAGTLAANPTALSMAPGDAKTFTITGGVSGYTVLSGDTSKATITVSGTTVTVTAVANGNTAINITDSVGSSIQVAVYIGTTIDPGLSACPIPPFTTAGVGPNVMLIIDNSGSMSDGTNSDCGPSDSCSKWEKANTAARHIVRANPHIRFGLMRMDRSGNDNKAKSGKVLVPCGYTGPFTTAADYIDWYIENLYVPFKDDFESQTNLAQTLASAGQYFATKLVDDGTGNEVPRGMRLGDTADNTAAMDFGYYKQDNNYTYTIDGTVYDARTTDDHGNTIDTTSPITLSCEKSFIIFLTDGQSFRDAGWDVVETVIGDVDGDGEEAMSPNCSGAEKCVGDKDGTPYMDDVAQYLYENDLRSDIDGIQNIITYVIGFALGSDDDTLMERAAVQGGGVYLTADNDVTQLVAAFNDAIADINAKISSGTAVSTIATSSSSDDYFVRAKFFPATASWKGYLDSFILPYADGDAAYWEAHTMLNDRIGDLTHTDRKIYTHMNDKTPKKQVFAESNSNLVNRLKTSSYWDEADSVTKDIIDYIRGDNTFDGLWRDRDGWFLGDIVYSSPVTVGPPKMFYFGNLLPEYANYQLFKTTHKDREHVVYVGANDGMLHAFKAIDDDGAACEEGQADYGTDKCGGYEKWALIPEHIQAALKGLVGSGCHQYYVDLTPVVANVWLGDKGDPTDAANVGLWRSLLIGGNRFGGSEYFALDVTDPDHDQFSILWDVKPFDGLSMKSSTLPVVGKVKAGDQSLGGAADSWAAVITSGYHEGGNSGRIAALKISDGTKLDIWDGRTTGLLTQAKSGPNAYYTLASPVAIDTDMDGYLDLIYAGDTEGALWKFYYDYAALDWKKAKIFQTAAGQAITNEPSVIFDPSGNLRIYFGTGKYLTDGDKDDTVRNAFYGLIDKKFEDTVLGYGNPNHGHFTRNQLIAGSDLTDMTAVITAAGFAGLDPADQVNALQNGWYFQLDTPGGLPAERCLARPVAIAGYVFFTSFMPNQQVCGYGGDARLYAVDYLKGLPARTEDGQKVLTDEESGKRFATLGAGIPSLPVYYYDPETKKTSLLVQKSDAKLEIEDPEGIGRPMQIKSWRAQ